MSAKRDDPFDPLGAVTTLRRGLVVSVALAEAANAIAIQLHRTPEQNETMCALLDAIEVDDPSLFLGQTFAFRGLTGALAALTASPTTHTGRWSLI